MSQQLGLFLQDLALAQSETFPCEYDPQFLSQKEADDLFNRFVNWNFCVRHNQRNPKQLIKRQGIGFVAECDDTSEALFVHYSKVLHNRYLHVMAYTVLASPRVVACLTTYFQDDPLQSFKAEVQRAYRNRKLTVAQVRAMTLHADLNGWGSASLPGLHGRDDEPVPENPIPQHVAPTASAPSTSRVPVGCRPVRDQAGVLQGYLKPDGQFVSLAVVEATR